MGATRMPLPRRFSFAEYLTIERRAETKSEYCQGVILATAGGLPDHSLIATNISSALAGQLKRSKCRVYNSDLRLAVAAGEGSFYPDAMVVCGDLKLFNRYRDVIANPVLVVEVLSRSTVSYDRLVKLPLYQRTPSIEDILLVSQDKARVEHLFRAGKSGRWKSLVYSQLADVVELPNIRCALALSDIYANVKLA